MDYHLENNYLYNRKTFWTVVVRNASKGNTCLLLVELQTSSATMEISVVNSLKGKSKSNIGYSYDTSWHIFKVLYILLQR